jgi:hypothetical protein
MSFTDREIALVKGMLLRGDNNQSIVACFGGRENPGRIADIKASTRLYDEDEVPLTTRARSIQPALADELPPPPPYPSPYELWKAGHSVWAARVALEHTKEKIEIALKALEAAEIKP